MTLAQYNKARDIISHLDQLSYELDRVERLKGNGDINNYIYTNGGGSMAGIRIPIKPEVVEAIIEDHKKRLKREIEHLEIELEKI